MIIIYQILFIAILSIAIPAEIIVGPYLQSATKNSIYILWETSVFTDTIVSWGDTEDQLITNEGSSFSNYNNSFIHTVEIVGLLPNTKYYYSILLDGAVSTGYSFITPPDDTSSSPFSIVAMSDMQKDYSNADKFYEIVHDGVIDYFSNHGSDISEEIAMILIPGDLVENGNSYFQWKEDFFDPAIDLLSFVPSYPVLGNHENNSQYYIKYFHLPDNGTDGYEEHWYYTDYANLRVIGLDSNVGYRVQEQLDWLTETLDEACDSEHIDFVFAQLHHPHKSELWVPGEIDYTGSVISIMENFTESCNKPSIHFFGHTHGYSRGQSKDHEHLWVNVATAGGNIDYWGEFQQNDYDEFTVTQDEWGFVVVNINPGDSPTFTLKRISRGNEYNERDNDVRDQVVIKLNNIAPDRPEGIGISGIQSPDLVVISASTFEDPDEDDIAASEWNIFRDCDTSKIPEWTKFVSSENWYLDNDTQALVDLHSVMVSGLDSSADYCFEVRYRDRGLAWSDWSFPVPFTTGDSETFSNLLTNPGAEDGTMGWIVEDGYMESLLSFECDGIEPYAGDYYFAVGGLCSTADYSEAYQVVDLSHYTPCIQAGGAYALFGGYLSNWGGSDYPDIQLAFTDSNGNEISRSNRLGTYSSSWENFSESIAVPSNAVSVRYIATGTKYSGDDNDSYFDNLFIDILESSQCDLIADFNYDGIQNILDIVILVEYILSGTSIDSADINGDGLVNIIDLIQLVNIILNRYA